MIYLRFEAKTQGKNNKKQQQKHTKKQKGSRVINPNWVNNHAHITKVFLLDGQSYNLRSVTNLI